jgi:6-phosphogluconate dehydrogenase (decarboxylating)
MQIGIIGLGRMGGNISRRLMKAAHRCVVFDTNAKPREALAREGATAVGSLEAVVKALGEKPRAVWVMLPAGQVTEETVERLGTLLAPEDIVIDGGNSFYKDDIRRAKKLAEKHIRYIDCGTSGGVWGIERGYCLMIGGPTEAVDHLDPMFAALAPGLGDPQGTAIGGDPTLRVSWSIVRIDRAPTCGRSTRSPDHRPPRQWRQRHRGQSRQIDRHEHGIDPDRRRDHEHA